jgi:hypothetical protein
MQAACLHARPCAEAGIPYDLQLYPRKTHSIAGPDVRQHLYNRILAHFEQYLKTGRGSRSRAVTGGAFPWNSLGPCLAWQEFPALPGPLFFLNCGVFHSDLASLCCIVEILSTHVPFPKGNTAIRNQASPLRTGPRIQAWPCCFPRGRYDEKAPFASRLAAGLPVRTVIVTPAPGLPISRCKPWKATAGFP